MTEVLYRRHDGKYITKKNNPNFTTSPTEVRKFCGILLSEYHEVPHVSNYWSTQPDLGVANNEC